MAPSTQQMLLPQKLDFPLESRWTDRCVDLIEWIHCKLQDKRNVLQTEWKPDQIVNLVMSGRPYLDVQIIYVIEKAFDSIFLSNIMQHDESYM